MSEEKIKSMQDRVVHAASDYFSKKSIKGLKIGDFVECLSDFNDNSFTPEKKYEVVDIITENNVPLILNNKGIRTPAWEEYFVKLTGSVDFIVRK